MLGVMLWRWDLLMRSMIIGGGGVGGGGGIRFHVGW